MTRWHSSSCQSPIVCIGDNSAPRCKACGASAHEKLQQLREHSPNPAPPLPPDEKPGQLNLYWPVGVPYTRSQTASLAKEIHDSLRISNTPSMTQKSLIHGRALAKDEFRLICLTPEERDLPEDAIHLSLETYNDGNFPDYEAVSYTWEGEDEDGPDGALRRPIYIGEHWDILSQTPNCYAMLRYLRPSRGIRMVWVDAICVNQGDIQERADQKPGVHPPRLPLHELENLKELQLPNKTERVSTQNLFKRKYLNKMRIIQELILPSRIAIPIGDKIFWADSSTPTHFERLPGRDWLWEQTRAPWFKHVTRGAFIQENLAELLTLTSKSRSSDPRDKVYGVLGLSSVKEGIKIRPDYGISLQHLLVGTFAHCVISERTPQLLLMAAGASAEADMPSWMAPWKEEAWEELFASYTEENLTWENVNDSLLKVRKHKQRALDLYLKELGSWSETRRAGLPDGIKQYRLVRFLPGSLIKEESKLGNTVFDRRPWHQDATVDADTGAMSLNLTRLVSIKDRPVRADTPQEGWYEVNYVKRNDFTSYYVEDWIYVRSRSQLDKVVEAGDDIFLLDTNVKTPIYLILRKTGNPREFRLIAACAHLAFLFFGDVAHGSQRDARSSWESLPVTDLQESLHTDLTYLRGLYDYEVSNGMSSSGAHSIKMSSFFPGTRGEITFKEVLPLLLGIARDEQKHKFKSWRGFQELYLESIDPKFQPRVSNGFCELSLNAEEEEEINNLLDGHKHEVEGWTKVPTKEDTGRVVLRRSMQVLEEEPKSMIWYSKIREDLDILTMLIDRLEDVHRHEDVDIGERMMAGSVEEDHFRGGTHWKRHDVFETFGLDGSTFRVRIV
ncbi:HET domain-containing protein [Fusarium sp. LHS14.1]|nr:HET domain-containing protein [Fusarium sp. LHS14.1]